MFEKNTTTAFVGITIFALAACQVSCWRFDPDRYDDYIGGMSREKTRPVEPLPPTPPVVTRPSETTGPLKVTVQEAIFLALANNRELAVERLNPSISQTFEQKERAVFDPVVGGEISKDRSRFEGASRPGSTVEKSVSGSVSAGVFLPPGTTVDVEVSTDVADSSLYDDSFTSTRVGLTVTQALLRGAGVRVNLVRLRQARLDTQASEYELRGFAEMLVAAVETAYWDYALAGRQIQIYTDSLKLAEQQMKETDERVQIGKLAETELAAAQAEVALRKENLINARSNLAKIRLQLLRLTNPATETWDREIILQDRPGVPKSTLDDVKSRVQVALRMRPEMNEARLAVKRGDLEIVKTRNGLLPKLDLFVTLGKTGYADSFGRSVRDLDDDCYDVLVGVTGEYPLGNRDARAQHRRAFLTRKQAIRAVENLAQLVEIDVQTTFIEVNRTREQISATAATRKFQAEKLRAETEKFRVGRSTSLLVAQAQRDLLSSQIAEVEAVVNYLKSLVELYRMEGSLLERRGVAAPGREPVGLRP
ncbi:MAG: TolC family protein [Planctomycetota bacterium]|nr:TolC family protein [Planctomycetota bacterium]